MSQQTCEWESEKYRSWLLMGTSIHWMCKCVCVHVFVWWWEWYFEELVKTMCESKMSIILVYCWEYSDVRWMWFDQWRWFKIFSRMSWTKMASFSTGNVVKAIISSMITFNASLSRCAFLFTSHGFQHSQIHNFNEYQQKKNVRRIP